MLCRPKCQAVAEVTRSSCLYVWIYLTKDTWFNKTIL